MSKRRVGTMLRATLLAGLLVSTAACSAEADLAAYFASHSPGHGASPAPSLVPATSQPASPTPPTTSPTSPAEPSPTATDLPSATDQPTSTPAWSPMPTRPRGLPAFAQLRESADVTDVSRLSANPGGLVGSTVYFEGRVNDVVENANGPVRARVKIGDSFVFVVYRTDRYWGDHPLVQGDRIRVVGEFLGLSSGGQPLPEIQPIDMVHRFT